MRLWNYWYYGSVSNVRCDNHPYVDELDQMMSMKVVGSLLTDSFWSVSFCASFNSTTSLSLLSHNGADNCIQLSKFFFFRSGPLFFVKYSLSSFNVQRQ